MDKLNLKTFLGMQCVKSPTKMPDNSATDVRDCVMERGLVKSRDGFRKLNSTSLGFPITGLYNYKPRFKGGLPPGVNEDWAFRPSGALLVTIDDEINEVSPKANAGADQTNKSVGTTITLNGSASTNYTECFWVQLLGTTVTLSAPTSAITTFTFIDDARFMLVVKNEFLYDVDSVNISGILEANAGIDQTSYLGATVTLDGSASIGAILYVWGQTSGTTVTLSDNNAVSPTFTMIDNATFQLTVFNALGNDSDSVDVLSLYTWTPKESNRAWYDIAISSDGSRQTIVVYGGYIYVSTNYGITWTPKDSVRYWSGVAMSETGQYQTAVVGGQSGTNGKIYISNDYGLTWVEKESVRSWRKVAMSSDGSRQTATQYSNAKVIYMSTDYGLTWTAKDVGTASGGIYDIAMSSDGQYQTLGVVTSEIKRSADYGATWANTGVKTNCYNVAMSSTGQYQTGVDYSGGANNTFIYRSADYGVTWAIKTNLCCWDIAMSSTGQYQTAVKINGRIYISIDYGLTWTAKESNRSWRGIGVSSTGQYQTAGVNGGQIYINSNYGA